MKHKKIFTKKIRGRLVYLAAIFTLVIASYIASSRTVSGLELDIFRSINNLPDYLHAPLWLTTQLGSVWFLVFMVIVLVGKRRKQFALKLLLSGASAFVVVEIMKRMIGRARPEYLVAGVHVRELYVSGFGFPSGHTAMATTAALLLYSSVSDKRRIWLYVWVAGVAFSRVYLGVHAPLDVVAGACVGILLQPIVNYLWKRFRQLIT